MPEEHPLVGDEAHTAAGAAEVPVGVGEEVEVLIRRREQEAQGLVSVLPGAQPRVLVVRAERRDVLVHVVHQAAVHLEVEHRLLEEAVVLARTDVLAAVAETLHDPDNGLGAVLDRLRALGLGGTLDAEAAPVRLRLDEAVEDVVVGHRAQAGLRVVAGDEHALGEVSCGAPRVPQLLRQRRTRRLIEAGPGDGLHAVVLGEHADVLPCGTVLERRQPLERGAEHAHPHELREGEAGRAECRSQLRAFGIARRRCALGRLRPVLLLPCRHQRLPSVWPPRCSSRSHRETAWGRCVTMNTVTSLMERIESSRRHSVSASSAEVDSSSTRIGAPL